VQITHILNEMRPETARIDLQTKKFEECRAALVALTGSAHKVVEGEEPYFKTPFMHINLPEHVLTAWAAEKWSPELTLPPRNPYLPTDFALRSEEVKSLDVATRDATNDANGNVARDNDEILAVLGSMTPYVVLDVPGLRVWYKLDRTFRVPRTAAYFRLSCPAAYTSLRAAAAGHLVVKLLEDALCEEAYLADVAGLHYGVWFEGSSGR
jgi:nardilysin